jgi:hypothetical protein
VVQLGALDADIRVVPRPPDVFRERIRDWSDADLSQLVELLGRLTSERHL